MIDEAEKIVECPRCGKEICIQISVEGDLISVNQEEERQLMRWKLMIDEETKIIDDRLYGCDLEVMLQAICEDYCVSELQINLKRTEIKVLPEDEN